MIKFYVAPGASGESPEEDKLLRAHEAPKQRNMGPSSITTAGAPIQIALSQRLSGGFWNRGLIRRQWRSAIVGFCGRIDPHRKVI